MNSLHSVCVIGNNNNNVHSVATLDETSFSLFPFYFMTIGLHEAFLFFLAGPFLAWTSIVSSLRKTNFLLHPFNLTMYQILNVNVRMIRFTINLHIQQWMSVQKCAKCLWRCQIVCVTLSFYGWTKLTKILFTSFKSFAFTFHFKIKGKTFLRIYLCNSGVKSNSQYNFF